ncbi:MAG: cache domain-containing protein [Proteobacteria bacterium]|nr:cache domain-containing protein [Pseudomonadota bacterium]
MLLTMFFVKRETEKQISLLQNKNAQQLVEAIGLNVESQYKNLIFHKQVLLKQKKEKINNIVHVALGIVEESYKNYKEGWLTEEEAKQRARDDIKQMCYSNEVDYIWINDTGRPIPRMLMYPENPELDGQLLSNPGFNSALGLKKNFFAATVDVVLQDGEGYVDYFWPKANKDGETAIQPKLAYVKLFREWNWVIGTGIYVDDIEEDTKKQINSILTTLRETFSKMVIGKSGYMYLFNGSNNLLVHPSLTLGDSSNLINPVTRNPMLEDLIAAAKTPAKSLEYIWDKPPLHKGEYRFWKKSHITYFEPLDWYIASTVYTDEIEAPAIEITRYIFFLSICILVFAFILSLLLSRHLTSPLQLLTAAAQKIDYDSMADAAIPVTGSIETRRLGSIMNKTLESIRAAVRSKEELFETKLSLELRLHQAEKLESVGRLAAGIAHEINTPTQYVGTNIDFLNDASKDISELLEQLTKLIATAHRNGNLEDDFADTVKEYFETADWEFLQEEIPKALLQSQEGLRRISKIVSAMKNFSHPGSGELESSDINIGIQSTVTLATNEWKYAAEMEMQLEDDLPLVLCYPDELNQVFLNMVINSAHAIAAHNQKSGREKGLITIQTEKIGKHVQIRISDSGGGMPDAVVDKIFEPFYTTKEVGKGTGQGLAIAHDVIVNKHHGSIDVQTELGQGTTFIISLPIAPPS